MKVNGYDLFFSGKESSVKKLMNILESTIVYETITYNMIGNTEMKDKHPIYFHDEYVITIMFDEPKLFTAEMNIKMFSVNNFLMNLLIEEHKLKNIEYLGTELYSKDDVDFLITEMNNYLNSIN